MSSISSIDSINSDYMNQINQNQTNDQNFDAASASSHTNDTTSNNGFYKNNDSQTAGVAGSSTEPTYNDFSSSEKLKLFINTDESAVKEHKNAMQQEKKEQSQANQA